MQTFRRLQRHVATALICLCALALAGTASAAAPHTLKDLSYQVLAGGKVELSLHFDAAPAMPRAFTTTTPPRIAFDFANTSNAVTTRHVDIGTGATSGVSVVAAGGRTRIVIDLFRSAQYRVRTAGDTMLITIGNGRDSTSAVDASAANNPTKLAPPSGPNVSSIDFRRGDHGGGRVIVDFSGAGAHADMHREGNRIVVNLGNVQLPKKLAQHLDVNDFATPVNFIETRATANGATMNIAAGGNFEASAYQTPTEYVIDVSPKAEVKAKKAPQIGADGLPKPVYTGQRVDFNFQDIPVRQVLHLIASESNLNLVVADSVQGNVTLRLKNVPWDQALDIVLRAKGLDKRESGNVLWVAPQEEIAKREAAIAKAHQAQEVNAPLISAYIPISYGKAADIAALLTTKIKQSTGGGAGAGASTSRGFLSPRGSVTSDERTNTLLVNDTAEQIVKIRNLVAKLDKPVQQVLIESRIVVATDTFARELGIKFGVSGGYQDSNGNVITTSGNLATAAGMEQQALQNRLNHNGAFPITPTQFGYPQLPGRLNVNLPTAASAGSFGLAILGADYLLDLELSAGQTEGKSEIISSPKVITANQQAATIAQGQQIGYQTTTTTGNGNSQPTVAFKDATLSLGVTPTITNDNRVFLALDVKKDSLAGYYQSATGQLPLIDHREIKTSVLVDNGATVVLGGISEQSKTNSVSKVPVLGDIPVLGALFRTKSKNNSRAELLIFVTPRILNDKLK